MKTQQWKMREKKEESVGQTEQRVLTSARQSEELSPGAKLSHFLGTFLKRVFSLKIFVGGKKNQNLFHTEKTMGNIAEPTIEQWGANRSSENRPRDFSSTKTRGNFGDFADRDYNTL